MTEVEFESTDGSVYAPVSGGGFTVFQKSTMKRRGGHVVATPTTSPRTTTDSVSVGETVDKDALHPRYAKQSGTESGSKNNNFFFFFE